MTNRRFPSKRFVRISGFVFALVAVASFVAYGVPGVSQRLVHAFASRAAQVKGLPGGQNKDQLTTRMGELDALIRSLKNQLNSDPKNQSLLAQLAAAALEYDQISASMGGDRAVAQGTPQEAPPPGPKDATLDQMQELQNTITSLKQQLASDPGNQSLKDQIEAAMNQLNTLSASMGGDLPTKTSARPLGSSPPAPTGCTATLNSFTNNTPVAIPTGPAVVTSTLNVAGAGSYLHDLNITTFITHTFNADLDITIQSPAGTVVTLTTDNGGSNDNVYNGTVWDDDANPAGQVPYATNNGLVGDHAYVNNVVASPLVPEESLAAFRGENPNGTWTITISDDLAGDGGSLNSWTLDVVTLPNAPTETTTMATNNTPVAIPTGPAVVTSTLVVAGAGASLTNLTLMTAITHTFNADLDITLQSPSGTVVTLTSDNGGSNDNVYNGTLWDDDANPAGQVPYVTNNGVVSDHAYVNLTTATPLTPEESFGAFIGENPNGTWTITISDDLAGDGGSLNSWTLNVTTGSCAGGPCSCTPTNFSNNTPVAIPTGPAVVTSTINVAGMGTYLYNLKATTFITHTFNADLDITLQSPAGTVVTLTTDNGGSNDNVYNGTVWDDKANPAGQVPYVTNNGLVTDHAYVNNVVATPLVPEEPLAAFTGENPNGTWTITISDDLAGDGGSLNSWSLDVCSLQSPPTSTTTTFNNNTPVAIPTGPAVVTSTIVVATPGTQIGNVRLTTAITHTFNADLDITIQSPTGTVATLSTDNGGSNDNVYNGTLWDNKANPAGQVPYVTNNGMVTDHAYVNNVVATPLTPEESFGAFTGENPNGTWTITISDDLAGDGGSLNSWSLEITTTTCGGGGGCSSITCPANVTEDNDPNQCGAVVTYNAPTPNGSCGTITCSPASGSFFPVGTTTVTCTSTAGPTCSFTVTVNDTQPPSITCPANITKSNDPNQCGAVVTYPPPTITDNCPGTFTATCTPASGSFFPVGTTTVTCSVNGTVPQPPQSIDVVNGGCVAQTITHSSSQAITPLNSVSCNDGFGHTDNSYWRAFSLPSFSITGVYNVTSVDVGIEEATAGIGSKGTPAKGTPGALGIKKKSSKAPTRPTGGGTQPITIRLHQTTSGTFPTGGRMQIATASFNLADQSGTVVNFPIAASVPAGSELIVEVFTPNGQATGNLIFIGSNASPETGPSYLSAADCGVPNPTTTAALGFPNMHIVMNVNGCEDTGGGGGGCDPATITHSSSQAITPLNSVSCNDGFGHTDNSYWRAFSLPAFSISGAFDVTSVDIGIEDAIAGGGGSAASPRSIKKNPKPNQPAGGGTQPITIRLHRTTSGTFPTGTRVQIASANFNVSDQSGTVVNFPIAASLPAGSELIVEVFTPDGTATGNLFFIGSNAAPETGPSYLSAADCGVPNPTTTAALGFPNMHIVMNVNGCEPTGGGSTCTFTVTVNDTQPPVITCPANVTAVAPQNTCNPGNCVVATFPPPTASDNCPGVMVVCNPPSGSCFPLGVTTVTCTATDASNNTATCSFTVTSFDVCLQDDSNPGNQLLFNSVSGAYRFCCNGMLLSSGVGKVSRQGCIITLEKNGLTEKVRGIVDKAVFSGNATLEMPGGTLRCTITDRDIRNNSCNCGGAPPPPPPPQS